MGTLIFPAERPTRHAPALSIPIHCEVCTVLLGRAECLQQQFTHMWKLHGHDENGDVVFITAAHYEGATLYGFSVIATLDGTMYRQPDTTADIIIRHLSMHSQNGHAPF